MAPDGTYDLPATRMNGPVSAERPKIRLAAGTALACLSVGATATVGTRWTPNDSPLWRLDWSILSDFHAPA